MNRLAEGPIDPYTVDRRDKANVLERDHISKKTTGVLFWRLACRGRFYTPEAYIPGFLVCLSFDKKWTHNARCTIASIHIQSSLRASMEH